MLANVKFIVENGHNYMVANFTENGKEYAYTGFVVKVEERDLPGKPFTPTAPKAAPKKKKEVKSEQEL